MKSRIKGKKIYRRRKKSKKRIAITADHAEIQGLTIVGRNRFYYEKLFLLLLIVTTIIILILMVILTCKCYVTIAIIIYTFNYSVDNIWMMRIMKQNKGNKQKKNMEN